MTNSTVNTSASGSSVAITVKIDPSDAARGWWVRVTSKYDYGYGKGQGVGDYPWIVEIIDHTGIKDTSYVATKTYKPGLYVAELNLMGIGAVDFSLFELTAVAAASKPSIFNYCWGTTVGTSCDIPPLLPTMKAGDLVKIKTDIANSGFTGKVRAVFKINGSQISSQDNASLGTFPSGGLWSPVAAYTMTSSSVTLSIEAYGWNGSTWVLNDTKSTTISASAAAPTCSNISLLPYSALLEPGSTTNSKVTMTASVLPLGVSFPISFIDSTGTILGTCNSAAATGTCTMVFDSATKAAGTYRITAIAGAPGSVGACTSNLSSVVVGVVATQYTLTVSVKDSSSGAAVAGASVLVGTSGGASSTKITDISGNVSFIVDMGTVGITVTKAGYNKYETYEYVYYSKIVNIPFVKTPVVPTTGGIQFVSVPVAADIYLDGSTASSGVTPVTINGLTAGTHTFVLKYAGFNDTPGTVVVQSGSVASVYISMPKATPTTGSLNITSHPVMGAEVFVDGRDMNLTTSGSAVVTEIPPGTHTYKLVLAGYIDASGSFNVVAGSNTFLDIALIPQPTIGTIEVTSEPSGADIYVNGTYANKVTPASISNLGAGSYKYKLMLSGYQDATGTFNIIAGNVTPLDVIMVAVPPTKGTLQITSTPPNAKVYIDGTDSNKVTPAIVEGLTEGNHTYLLKLSGYKEFGAVVAIIAGDTKSVDVPLEQVVGEAQPSGIGIGTVALAAAGVAAVVILSKKSK